jgi:hypothetical protein
LLSPALTETFVKTRERLHLRAYDLCCVQKNGVQLALLTQYSFGFTIRDQPVDSRIAGEALKKR